MPRCGNCLSKRVTSVWERSSFYAGPEPIQIEVRIPIRSCLDCHFRFTDSEADEIKHKAQRDRGL